MAEDNSVLKGLAGIAGAVISLVTGSHSDGSDYATHQRVVDTNRNAEITRDIGSEARTSSDTSGQSR